MCSLSQLCWRKSTLPVATEIGTGCAKNVIILNHTEYTVWGCLHPFPPPSPHPLYHSDPPLVPPYTKPPPPTNLGVSLRRSVHPCLLKYNPSFSIQIDMVV